MINLDTALQSMNLAEDLDQNTLDALGRELCDAIEDDDRSRQGWLSTQEEWLKLASQVTETKGYPWQGASNVKYPLLTLACVHFHARALPGLINNERPVLAKVTGRGDPQKDQRANRVSTFTSYQVTSLMGEWMDVMDRLLFVLPMVGLCFKKTFYSEMDGRNISELVLPSELIINYYATSYKRARMTHCRYMDANEVIEHQRAGFFLDVDLQEVTDGKSVNEVRDDTFGLTPGNNEMDEEFLLHESHCFLDLDDDGYKEPYIVTIDSNSRKILRIVARWDEQGIKYNERGEVQSITPTDYFTPYQFIPDPNSSVYALGFGSLLGSTNESVNTLINQLIDAGSLSNLQSGFIGRGVKLKGGATRFKPGEWKLVNSTGDDLRKAIFPMPIREPSGTLLSLLQLLLDAGQQVTSVSDMMMGENPGQNQKATTTMAVLEQGLAVFKGIYRRLHRALTKELILITKLNYKYLDEELYHNVLDDILPEAMPGQQGMMPQQGQGSIEDFNMEDMNILPTSDPSIITDAQKLMKAQSLIEKMSMGMQINPMVVTKRVLEAEQQEDIPELMTMPPKGPSPEEQEMELSIVDRRIKMFEAYFTAIEKTAKAESLEQGTQIKMYQAIVDDMIKTLGVENEASDRQQKMQQAQVAAQGAGAPVGA